jgi:OmpA family protein
VTFAYDNAGLLPAAQDQLKIAAKWLKRHPHTRVVLEGHCDSSGRRDYNEDLATRRLQQVRDDLRLWGVPTDRIVLVVYGETGAQRAPNPNDRRVILFASHESVRDIVDQSLVYKHARIAYWTERDTLHSLTLGTRGTGTTARR